MTNTPSYYIYGSKSYAHTISHIAKNCGFEIKGFIDDYSNDEGIVGNFESFKEISSRTKTGIFIGVGYKDLPKRRLLLQQLRLVGTTFPSLISSKSIIDQSAIIDEGCVIMNGAIVELNCKVGFGTTLWPGVVLNHDSEIGENTFVSPGAVICGNVKIGRDCFIGASAVIVDGREVPDGSFIKASSLYK